MTVYLLLIIFMAMEVCVGGGQGLKRAVAPWKKIIFITVFTTVNIYGHVHLPLCRY
jgi:hypothetical protein